MSRSQIHFWIFYFGLIGVVIALPFSWRVASAAVVILAINAVCDGQILSKLKALKSSFYFWLFSGFYLLHVIAMLYTNNTTDGLSHMEKKLSLLVLPFVLATSDRLDRKYVNNILKAFLIAVISASLVCLGYAFHRNNYLETFRNPNWFYFAYGDLTEIIDMQPNYLALFVSFSIIIVIYFLLIETQNNLKVIARIILVTYLFFFLILLSGRTAIFATVIILIGGGIYFFYKRGKLLPGFFALAGFLLVVFAVIYSVPIMRERLLETFDINQTAMWINQWGTEKSNTDDRFLKWICAWREIQNHWIIGVGPGDGQDALQVQYQMAGYSTAFNEHWNPHNQFLQTWLALGVIGLLFFLMGLTAPMLKALKEGEGLYVALIALFGICCLTESMLERQWGIIFYALFNSLFAFHLGPTRSLTVEIT